MCYKLCLLYFYPAFAIPTLALLPDRVCVCAVRCLSVCVCASVALLFCCYCYSPSASSFRVWFYCNCTALNNKIMFVSRLVLQFTVAAAVGSGQHSRFLNKKKRWRRCSRNATATAAAVVTDTTRTWTRNLGHTHAHNNTLYTAVELLKGVGGGRGAGSQRCARASRNAVDKMFVCRLLLPLTSEQMFGR